MTRHEFRMLQQGYQEIAVGFDTGDLRQSQPAQQALQSGGAIWPGGDQLGDHRIIKWANHTAGFNTSIHPQPRPKGQLM